MVLIELELFKCFGDVGTPNGDTILKAISGSQYP